MTDLSICAKPDVVPIQIELSFIATVLITSEGKPSVSVSVSEARVDRS